MMPIVLTTHESKVAYVQQYLTAVERGEEMCPLIIAGGGATGKSFVINEIGGASNIPIVVIHDNTHRYFPGKSPDSNVCAMIFTTLGLQDDIKVAAYFNSKLVQFKPDISYTKP
jgi:hypothetical protein